jgi:hypothetical protein
MHTCVLIYTHNRAPPLSTIPPAIQVESSKCQLGQEQVDSEYVARNWVSAAARGSSQTGQQRAQSGA